MTSNVDVLTSVLALEDKCALNYVMNSAWPDSHEKADKAAEAAFQAAWASEKPFLGRIGQAISNQGDVPIPLLDDCFDFSPSRLNFATWSHLLTVVPELIEVEIDWLNELLNNDLDQNVRSLIEELITEKEQGASDIVALAEKQAEARAQAEAGEVVADDVGGGGDSFRDADMPIEDRLALAAGKDKFTQLWAAMAQTDCTACGYDCEGYAQAIADGEDKDLGKCVPGEDATANAIKSIVG